MAQESDADTRCAPTVCQALGEMGKVWRPQTEIVAMHQRSTHSNAAEGAEGAGLDKAGRRRGGRPGGGPGRGAWVSVRW